jgi:hypothetical protein
MRKSIVYSFVVLILLSLGLTLVPSAHSQPENIKIVSYSYYVDSSGFLEVVGEIQNMGTNTVASVILTGSVYSSDGTDQGDSRAQAWVAYLTPQQKAPFYMTFYSPNNSPNGPWSLGEVSNIKLTVSTADATSSYQYQDLKIKSSSATIGTSGDFSGAYTVNGIIQNTGSQTAQNLTVVGTFYNSTGAVVAVGYTNYLTPAFLSPSGTISFQVSAFDLNQTGITLGEKITSYSLLIQALGPILQGTAPVITSSPSPASSSSPSLTSFPSSSPSVSQSPVANPTNSLKPELIYAIVVVVGILAVVGAILLLRKPKRQNTVKAAKSTKEDMVGILRYHF